MKNFTKKYFLLFCYLFIGWETTTTKTIYWFVFSTFFQQWLTFLQEISFGPRGSRSPPITYDIKLMTANMKPEFLWNWKDKAITYTLKMKTSWKGVHQTLPRKRFIMFYNKVFLNEFRNNGGDLDMILDSHSMLCCFAKVVRLYQTQNNFSHKIF